jgi:hypothetical protein
LRSSSSDVQHVFWHGAALLVARGTALAELAALAAVTMIPYHCS